MSKITESARGECCAVRLPEVCNHNIETVVCGHYRLSGYCGTGIKPPDWMAAYVCSACHDVIDGRVEVHWLSRDAIRLYHAEGVLRTQAKLIEKGLLEVVK
jgi:hypothetical protein